MPNAKYGHGCLKCGGITQEIGQTTKRGIVTIGKSCLICGWDMYYNQVTQSSRFYLETVQPVDDSKIVQLPGQAYRKNTEGRRGRKKFSKDILGTSARLLDGRESYG